MCKFLRYILIAFVTSSSVFAEAKDRVGNGGDEVALQFNYEAKHLLRLLSLSSLSRENSRIVAELDRVLASVRIQTTMDPLNLSGFEVDAINYPDQIKIILNRPRWATMFSQGKSHVYFPLILHELLGASGYDDSKYEISEDLMLALKPIMMMNKISKSIFLTTTETLRLQVERLIFNRALNKSPRNVSAIHDPWSSLDKAFCFEEQSFRDITNWVSAPESAIDQTFFRIDPELQAQLASLGAIFQIACPSKTPIPPAVNDILNAIHRNLETLRLEFDVAY